MIRKTELSSATVNIDDPAEMVECRLK